MDLFRKYLTGPQNDNAPTGAETVERLTDRVQSSTLTEDRRDAVRALKSLSKKFRLEVGTRSMDALVQVLKEERTDSEMIGYALETLCNVMSSGSSLSEEDEPECELPEDIGLQFSEMFIKNVDNVSLLLSLLQEYDYHVILPTVRLLTILLRNKTRDVQEIILAQPTAISKLMDLLSDSREVVRNEDLLLLIELTRANTNIQKIVAFENAFEKLFEIIGEEGNSDGGVVVEDCLLLLLNLLRNNISNQNFLKEGSYIQKLPQYFDLGQIPVDGLSTQKVNNIGLMLKLVRTLVSPNNPLQQINSCQKVINQCGLLEKLCSIFFSNDFSSDIQLETINAVSEIIRGNQFNQEFFASIMIPSQPPRSLIVSLLMSMVSEKQCYKTRCAILYCFESFLYKNELGQSQIVQTLLPSTTEVSQVSAGHLLCRGLFSSDPISSWLASVALLHAVVNNPIQKKELLRVQLATSLGNPPVTLLQQCTNMLIQGVKFQQRVGLLQLLCHWLADSQMAVTNFLQSSASVPYLISQVSASEADENEVIVQGLSAFLLGILVLYNNDQVPSYHRLDLRQIIEKRIGIEQFGDKLSQISKQESYNRSAKMPEPKCKQSEDIVFDYEFTKLFKRLENEVVKTVSSNHEPEHEKKSSEHHDSVVEQYKVIIREQDCNLNAVKQELMEMRQKHYDLEKRMEESGQIVQQLRDQNALLRVQNDSASHREQRNEVQENGISTKVNYSENETNQSQSVLEELTSRLEEYKKLLSEKQNENESLKERLFEMVNNSKMINGNLDNQEISIEKNKMAARMLELEESLNNLKNRNSDLKRQIDLNSDVHNSRIEQLNININSLEREKTEVEVDRDHILSELDNLKKEQDDLLMLLTEQDNKIKLYKEKLRELGQKIEDDDEDEIDDDLENLHDDNDDKS